MSYTENKIAVIASKFVNGTNRHVFLTGKAGTGKTTFLKQIKEYTHKNCIVAAPTGIAAINAGGVTLHSLFHLPFGTFVPGNFSDYNDQINIQLNTPRTLLANLKMNRYKRDLIRELELLIIDEVSMLRADLLDAIDVILQHIRRKKNIPFGGLQILFIGDLMQLPPVVKNDEIEYLRPWYDTLSFFGAKALKESPPLYLELDKIYRQSDQEFIAILNHIRDNEVTDDDIQKLNKYFKPDFKPGEGDGYIFLTTHNNKADNINRQALNRLNNKPVFYHAEVSGDFSEYLFPVDFTLELKKGAQVMFIKNDYSGEQRYFNGKIGIIASLSNDEIVVEFEDGTYTEVDKYSWENKKFKLNKETHEIEEKTVGTFMQYPLRLAWAITVHKSQGLTFNKAIIDVASAFTPGQSYVALSRLTSPDGLILTSPFRKNGLPPDDSLKLFTSSQLPFESLEEDYRKEAIKYIRDYITSAFDLTDLVYACGDHLETYNKEEGRSAMQKHRSWALKLKDDIIELNKIAGKFIHQVKSLTSGMENDKIKFLEERLKAARIYFENQLRDYSKRILLHIEKARTTKGTKNYVKELRSLEDRFYFKLRKIDKAKTLVNSILNDRDISRYTIMGNVTRESVISDETGENQKKKTGTKQKTKKNDRVNTRDISLMLFKEGKSIEEIAKERNFAASTIEGHLSYQVGQGQLEVFQFVDEQKVSEILEACKKSESLRLNELKQLLGDEFTYSDLKFGLAYKQWLEGKNGDNPALPDL
ncbi:MAG: helix-turn-helix domain-containing protein [Bacteroidales bacterium]